VVTVGLIDRGSLCNRQVTSNNLEASLLVTPLRV
jgi:hypothetical protein